MPSVITISPEEIAYQQAHYQDDKTHAIVLGSILLITMASIAVIMRLLSRKIQMQKVKSVPWGADDGMIIVALLFAYGMFVSNIYAARYGLGKHILTIGLPNTVKAHRAIYVLEAIFPACTAATKISILLLYRRIFTTHNPYFKYAMYIISFVLVGWAISGFCTTVFQCTPVHHQWDHLGGTCIDWVPALIALATINTVVNASILILPMPMVWYLNMPRRRKIAVCGIFVIGSGDVISGVVRTYSTAQIKASDVDITWIATEPVMLALVEPCLGIICACLPVMRPLFGSIFGGVVSNVFSNKHSTKGSNDSRSTHPENGWIELGGQDPQRFVSKIHGGKELQSKELEQELSMVPSTGIQVRSDLESFATREL